jgi:hypothetical protein
MSGFYRNLYGNTYGLQMAAYCISQINNSMRKGKRVVNEKVALALNEIWQYQQWGGMALTTNLYTNTRLRRRILAAQG